MKRREFTTTAVGIVGTGMLAGCVGDSTGNGDGKEPTDEPTDEPDTEDGAKPTETPDTNDGESATEEADASDGPVAVTEAFLASLESADPEEINSYLHPETPLEPIEQTGADELAQTEFNIEQVALKDQGEGWAVVDVTFAEVSDDQIQLFQTVELRTAGDGWKIYQFRGTEPENRPTPAANFEIELEDESVRITHTDGESIPAEELSIRGEGLAQTGLWTALGGETADGRVVAGIGVSVETTAPTVRVQVVWKSPDGETAATLESATLTTAQIREGDAPEPVVEYLSDANVYEGVTDWTDREEATVTVGAGDGFAFRPAAVRISPGTTIVWEWSDSTGAHNVFEQEETFQSELTSEAGTTFSHTFEETGNYLYYCQPHKALGMKGAIIVE